MNTTAGRILITLTALLLMASIACDVDYEEVPPADDDWIMTAGEFVTLFNKQEIDNKYVVGDWAENGKVFGLRLPDISVGNDTLTYEPQGWFTNNAQAICVECVFNDTKPVRVISNGDTVDIWGATTVVERGLWRIKLRMENCGVRKVEGGP